jgi:5-methyltetrahydropteroyltriglutamate--homocysteine methyltransferase
MFHNPSGDIEFTPAALHVGSKIHMAKTIFEADFTYLQSLAGSSTTKLTIPSPNMVHYRGGPAAIDPEVYPDIEEFWSDLSAAYADEVARLAALGCTYLQFDDTSLAYLNDPVQRAEIAARGEDADHLHLRYICQVNDALAAKPAGMAVTTHMCRGLMFAAPSAGALVVTVVSGWMGRVRRHGLAIAISAAVWGLLIAAFGLAPDIAVALGCLALAGRPTW